MVEILQNFVAFSEYMNLTNELVFFLKMFLFHFELLSREKVHKH